MFVTVGEMPVFDRSSLTRENRRKSRLSSTVVDRPSQVVSLMAIALFGVCGGCNQNADEAAYRTIDESFAIRRSQGWELIQAPEDGKRYRICGVTESGDDPNRRSFSGAIRTGGRVFPFEFAIPPGKMVAVEGLEPLEGGRLTYAVLQKDLPAGELTTDSTNRSSETKSRSKQQEQPMTSKRSLTDE